MSEAFKITFSWKKRAEPEEFDADDYVDASALFLSLEHFLSLYEGKFQVTFDDIRLELDFDPDLSTIFEEIPDVLEELVEKTDSNTELYFFEQGTDIALLLERKCTEIRLRIDKRTSVGFSFESLPDDTYSIGFGEFLKEWTQFAAEILNALAEMEPTLVGEESYQEYLSRLGQIESVI